MDAKRRVIRARVQLLLHRPFWGHLAMYLEPVESPTLARGTMGNDGVKLYYDPKTVDSWSDQELLAVIAHECGHPAFGHFWRREHRDPLLFNIAGDYAINPLLELEGFTLPKGCLLDHQFDNMASETIYAKLMQQAKKNAVCSHCSGGSGQGIPINAPCSKCGGNGTLDDPKIWEQATANNGQPAKGKDAQGQDASGQSDQSQGPTPVPNGPQIWRQRVTEAAVAAKLQGKLPGHLASLVDDLLNPKLNWKELLREYIQAGVKNDYRMFPSSKKYLWFPIYLPALAGEYLEIAVAIDTSGSISDKMLAQFASEVTSIAQQFESWKIHLFQCDAQVNGYYELSSDDDADWPKALKEFKGRGGTSFVPVFEHMDKLALGQSVAILIYLTDLCGTFPTHAPEYPVLWVSTDDGKIPFGSKILIQD